MASGVAVAPSAEPRERAGVRLGGLGRGELAAWGALIALALALRLIGLGDRPFHHDESQDAYFSWLFRTTGQYAYNPLLHGPLRFYLTAAVYVLFGDSDFTARLAPALMGTAMVPLCLLLRPLVGRLAAFAAAVALAIGPTYLYFSRFAREDIYVACLTLALIAVAFRFLERPRPRQPALLGALLALSFATKESTFITVFVIGTFFVAVLAHPRRRARVVEPVKSVGWEPWAWALATFAGVFTILFTTFLTHPAGLWDGLYTGLKYWLSQHAVHRGGEPPGFYVVLLAGEEWPALLLGAVGALAVARRPTLFGLFLIWDFVLSLAVYSWAGEKFAWLVMHPLLPLLLLAGVGVQAIAAGPRRWRWLGLLAVAGGLGYAVVASWWVNVDRGADPRELLVSTQSSTEVKRVAQQVVALDARAHRRLLITVDAAQGATFPYAWYFRHLNAGYVDLTQSALPPDTDVLVVTEASRARLGPALVGYTGRRFPFRVWWVRDYGKAINPGDAWRYLTKRQVWNPTGGMKEWLCVRKGV